MQLEGRRVTLMGLGHFGGGIAAARWLARQGALVTVTDLADEHALADSLARLASEPIARFHLGGHRESDFRRADLVIVNPAVRPDHPLLAVAANAGARLTSEIELFLNACPAETVGVTGSNGKSTTAAMTAAISQADGRPTWLGGNLGGSLLERLPEIGPADAVVLEISSFQLWHLSRRVRMPRVAVLTNCTPNHLNWHGRWEDYVAAKQRILTGQSSDDLAVLNTADAEVASWAHLVRGRQLPLVGPSEIPNLAVPGNHNRTNAVCAATAAAAFGCRPEAVRRALESFSTLPGRLEEFAVIGGRHFYNDTTATTPEATIAALGALEGRVWLLAGGADKGADFRPLASMVAQRAQGAAFFGKVRRVLQSQVLARAEDFPCCATETMAEALRWCWQHSGPGDRILFSPASASYDQFRNFSQRGAKFVEAVRAMANLRK